MLEEASQRFKWIKDMKEEVNASKKNQTRDTMPKLVDVKPISYKQVYRIKPGANGSIKRYKACLVTHGFLQQFGLDYDEIFSLVVKLTNVHVLLALIANKNQRL